MPQLSENGKRYVHELSKKHGVSVDAAMHMLVAVSNGNGTMAQFNHPEFGGSGQWMRGGMTMVSDLFNYQLKSRVDNICSDISNEVSKHSSGFGGSFQSQSQSGGGNSYDNRQSQASGSIASSGASGGLFERDPEDNWWPQEFGPPSALGSQNNVRYAYFAGPRRLAVSTGGDTWVYDTLEHQIGGFSQQQGANASISFSSQFGTINLSSLPVLSRGGVAVPPHSALSTSSPSTNISQSEDPGESSASHQSPVQPSAQSSNSQTNASSNSDSSQVAGQSSSDERSSILATLERLGELMKNGVLTEEEFTQKKAELLSRL